MPVARALNDHDLPGYVEFIGAPPEERPALLERLRAGFADASSPLRDVIIRIDDNGAITAAIRLLPLADRAYVLSSVRRAPGVELEGEEYGAMVAAALGRARRRNALKVSTRPIKDENASKLEEGLRANGFRFVGERVEFHRSLTDLPSDEGSPLTWRSMTETGPAFAADMLRRCSAGDPNSAEDENPVDAINEFLSDTELTTDPDCVQIGYLDGTAVAFVCAQVMPSSGWSRIAYIGVVPEARGRGVGRWAHRHGFTMMREQGGKDYHGGTAATNKSMLALFVHHGCVERARMTEWEWKRE